MTTWATANEVLTSWIGDDFPDDDSLVETWISKAERLVRFKIPGLQARIDAGTEPDLLDNTIDVVSAMVQRVFRNPEGIRQDSTTTGPFTESRTYGGTTPGVLALTDDEVALLSAGTSGGQRAFTVSMIPAGSAFGF
jgi:hypothetical protein